MKDASRLVETRLPASGLTRGINKAGRPVRTVTYDARNSTAGSNPALSAILFDAPLGREHGVGCCGSGPKDRGLWPVGGSSLAEGWDPFRRGMLPKWPNVSLGPFGSGIPGLRISSTGRAVLENPVFLDGIPKRSP